MVNQIEEVKNTEAKQTKMVKGVNPEGEKEENVPQSALLTGGLPSLQNSEFIGLLPYAGDIQVAMREHNRLAIRKILTARRLQEEKGRDLTKSDILEAFREIDGGESPSAGRAPPTEAAPTNGYNFSAAADSPRHNVNDSSTENLQNALSGDVIPRYSGPLLMIPDSLGETEVILTKVKKIYGYINERLAPMEKVLFNTFLTFDTRYIGMIEVQYLHDILRIVDPDGGPAEITDMRREVMQATGESNPSVIRFHHFLNWFTLHAKDMRIDQTLSWAGRVTTEFFESNSII